jgi:hypothetical protein
MKREMQRKGEGNSWAHARGASTSVSIVLLPLSHRITSLPFGEELVLEIRKQTFACVAACIFTAAGAVGKGSK